MMAGEDGKRAYRYRAFISYSHLDHAEAVDLHYKLEHFVLPRAARAVGSGLTYDRQPLRPVFRDEAELVPGQDLPKRIHDALETSEYLIVLCSPNAVASEWVGKEVAEFIALGRRDNILSVVIAGQPDAATLGRDPSLECMPEPLRKAVATEASGHADQLWVDWRGESRNDRTMFLRVVAALLALQSLDDLVQRDAQDRRRAVLSRWVSAAAVLLVLAVGSGLYAAQIRDQALTRSNTLAGLAQSALAKSDYESAGRLALIGMDGFDRPLLGFAPVAAETALRSAVDGNRRVGGLLTITDAPPKLTTFSEDGEVAATLADDGTVRLINARSGAPVGASFNVGADANAVALSPDKTLFAAVTELGEGYTLQIFDTVNGTAHPPLHGTEPMVPQIAFSHDGTWLAAVTADFSFLGAADIWDVRAGTMRSLALGVDAVSSVAFSHDGKTLATGVNGGFALWEVATAYQIGTTLTPRLTDDTDSWVIAYAPDDKSLIMASSKSGGPGAAGKLRLWDFSQGFATADRDFPVPIDGVRYAPDGESVAAHLSDGEVVVIEVSPLLGTLGLVFGNAITLTPVAGAFAFAGADNSIVGQSGTDLRRWMPFAAVEPTALSGRALIDAACAGLVPGTLSRLSSTEVAQVSGSAGADACGR